LDVEQAGDDTVTVDGDDIGLQVRNTGRFVPGIAPSEGGDGLLAHVSPTASVVVRTGVKVAANPPKVALTGCMRKLLTTLNAIVRDGTPWRGLTA